MERELASQPPAAAPPAPAPAGAAPGTPVQRLLAIQRTAGNRAAVSLLRQSRGTRRPPSVPSAPGPHLPGRTWGPPPERFTESEPTAQPLYGDGPGDTHSGYPAGVDDPVNGPLFAAFQAFEAHNLGDGRGAARAGGHPGLSANLTHEQAGTVFAALRTVFARDLPAATHILQFFASRRFRQASDEELEMLDLFRPQGLNAVAAEYAGVVSVRPDFFALPEPELVGLLLHEMAHTGHVAGIAGSGENARPEGEAYGAEYALLEHAGGSAGRLQWLRANADTGWGEVSSGIPEAKDAFNRTYRACRVLYELIDGHDAYGLHIAPADARGAIFELLETQSRGRLVQRVLAWVDEHGDRIPPPVR